MASFFKTKSKTSRQTNVHIQYTTMLKTPTTSIVFNQLLIIITSPTQVIILNYYISLFVILVITDILIIQEYDKQRMTVQPGSNIQQQQDKTRHLGDHYWLSLQTTSLSVELFHDKNTKATTVSQQSVIVVCLMEIITHKNSNKSIHITCSSWYYCTNAVISKVSVSTTMNF